jgi:hypothetical protein
MEIEYGIVFNNGEEIELTLIILPVKLALK